MKKIPLQILLSFLAVAMLAGCVDDERLNDSSQMGEVEQSVITVWESINETTWYKTDDWTGETYVFYTDHNGDKKAIHQYNGSGVRITSREWIDFEVIDEKAIKIGLDIYELNEGDLVSETSTLTLYAEEPLIYNMACGPIDMEIVKSDEFIVEDILQQCDK